MVPMVPLQPPPFEQPTLFDTADQAWLRPLDAERRHLGDGAWVEVAPGWVGRPDLLFGRLIEAVPWRKERRPMYDRMVDVPRLVAFYGAEVPLPDPLLTEARCRLADRYGQESCGPVRTAGLCLYRDGSDSVAWHGDTLGRRSSEDTLVAVVSLGQRRRFMAAVQDLDIDLEQTGAERADHLVAAQHQPALIAFEGLAPDGQASFQAQLRQTALGRQQGDGLVPQQPVALGHHPGHAHGGGQCDGDDRQRHQHFDQGETTLVVWTGHQVDSRGEPGLKTRGLV